MGKSKVDRIFIFIAAVLVLVGIFIFTSASLGILAKNEQVFLSMVVNQLLIGLSGGFCAFFLFSKIPYRFWKKYALLIFIFSLTVTSLVFVPGIGLAHGGATRWLDFGFLSFQPSELLKFALVIYLAAWFSWFKDKANRSLYSVIPLFILLAVAAGIMLKQPDTGTFMVMVVATLSIYFVSGAKWKHLFIFCLIGIVGLSVLVATRPYLKDRLVTFFDPTRDPRGSSYQIQQSLLAIGSGELFGRGLGQSVQKFSYLPEPVGDSVFAVIGEELGFVGGTITVLLFLIFGLRGLKIANRSPDFFSSYLVVGLTALIVSQSFLNIASLIGIFPLTGVPLAFISHGGTALLFAMAEVGIIVNISSYAGRT